MSVHHLHEPIDVFSEWLDDCEAAQTGRQAEQEVPAEDSDDDDNIPDSSGLNSRQASKPKAPPKQAVAAAQPSYTALGLDDSDDSDDDE